MKVKLRLLSQIIFLCVCSNSFVFARGEITVIHYEEEAGTHYDYSAKNRYGQMRPSHWGRGRNIKINGFDYADTTFEYKNVADRVVIRRVDNNYSSGTSCSLFAESKGGSLVNHEVDYPYDTNNANDPDNCDMAKVMGGRIINIGALDVFANGPEGTQTSQEGSYKNIERVDFIFTTGIKAPKNENQLSMAGHVVTEKSGNNPVKMAAILSLGNDGEPSSYGNLVSIKPHQGVVVAGHPVDPNDIHYGITNVRTRNNFVSNSMNASVGGAGWIGVATENLGMAFVSLEDMGVPANSTYFGFSYFGDDVTVAHDLTNPSSFPLDTPIDGTASVSDTKLGIYYTPGQADMYGGVAGYFIDICLVFSGDVSEVSPALTSQVRVGDSIYSH